MDVRTSRYKIRKRGLFAMIQGIIDIGSNTIRLSIYRCEGKRIHLLLNKKTTAGLAGYAENGRLSEKGIQTACTVLSEYRDLLENFSIPDVRAFATASLRNIKNTQEATDAILRETGLAVEVISGKEEARLDFIGATQVLENSDGMLVDIGGGSTEFVSFRDREILTASSVPVGSLNTFSKYVGGLFPTPVEIKYISQMVTETIAGSKDTDKRPQKILCGVGGTVRSAAKLNNSLYGLASDNPIIATNHLKKMLKMLNENYRESLKTLLRVVPDRVHTILPGMVILATIAKYYKSESIVVSRYGVREGYLIDRVLS